ncbi:Uncharacterised protein [Bordetella pertussis]|nr:Uncharacterised protein [Bordetella pertussis]CFW38594.1 Uncharacterised protein [Bordetella pertussis]
MPVNRASNRMAARNPTAMTLSVSMALLTSTLSMTTWKNKGVNRAMNCSTNEISSTSPMRWRCLTSAGMNQLKSKRARACVGLAAQAQSSSSPAHSASNSACPRRAGAWPGRWMSTAWSAPGSKRARTK